MNLNYHVCLFDILILNYFFQAVRRVLSVILRYVRHRPEEELRIFSSASYKSFTDGLDQDCCSTARTMSPEDYSEPISPIQQNFLNELLQMQASGCHIVVHHSFFRKETAV